MPRAPRNAAGGIVYHALNRGNARMRIFHKPDDYRAFIDLMVDALKRVDMRVLGFCLMPNHWHMVLWPKGNEDLSDYVAWIANTHVRRWQLNHDRVGEGHLYQGRFKSFPVQDDAHFLTLLRYVEANARRAKLVDRAEDWPHSSLWLRRNAPKSRLLRPWPVVQPPHWLDLVNEPIPEGQREQIQTSINRGRPFGDPQWQAKTARRLGVEQSLRDPWRPRKPPPEE
jgi:putative transposase